MADHPRPVGRAFTNIAKLLPDQRVDAMVVVMMPMIPRQILASDDLWLMRTALIALMRDPIVSGQNPKHRRRSQARGQ